MKSRTIAALTIALFSSAAIATGSATGHNNGNGHNKVPTKATKDTSAKASASAVGVSNATGYANIGPLTNNFNFSSPSIPGYTVSEVKMTGTSTVKNNPAIGFQAAPATANCMNNVGLGGGGTGGSALISFNFSVDWCVKTYLAEKARDAGKDKLSEELFCSIPEVKELNSEDCRDAANRTVQSKARTESDQRAREQIAEVNQFSWGSK